MFRAAVPRGEPVQVRVVLVAERAQHQQPVPREGDVRRLVVVPRQRLPVLLPVSGVPYPTAHHPAPCLGMLYAIREYSIKILEKYMWAIIILFVQLSQSNRNCRKSHFLLQKVHKSSVWNECSVV